MTKSLLQSALGSTMLVNLSGQSYQTRSTSFGSETCINLFPSVGATNTKYASVLYTTPGLTQFVDLTGHEVRALFEKDDVLYAVVDQYLYTITVNPNTQAITSTQVGSLQSNAGQVSIIDNDTQLMLADGLYGYYYTIATSTLTWIQGQAFGAITKLTYQDGYGIMNENGTNKFRITGINNFSTIDALDFASTNSTPDPIVSLIATKLMLLLFKKRSTEIWLDSGAAAFPFERRSDITMTQGCAAAFSVAEADNSVFWLTKSRSGQGFVVRMDGYAPKVISTEPIDYMISQFSRIDDAIGYVYSEQGHLFYVLTFPTADRTLVYDASASAWHERRSTISTNNTSKQGRHRGNCYAFFNNKHYVGDFQSGKIYEMRSDVYTEGEAAIVRQRRFAHFFDEQKRVSINSFNLDVEKGIGLATGQGSDPQIMLKISRDGGHTWGNELWRSAGKIGEYGKRIKWNRLGYSRDWVGELTMSDPVPWVIMGATLDISGESPMPKKPYVPPTTTAATK